MVNHEETKKEEIQEELTELKREEFKEEEKISEEVIEKKDEEKVKEKKALDYEKANLFDRFVAFLIDIILTFLIIFLSPLLFGRLLGDIGWPLIVSSYILLRDGFDFLGNRSIGKIVTKLKPIIRETGANCDLITSAKRNCIFAIGYFLISFDLYLFINIPEFKYTESFFMLLMEWFVFIYAIVEVMFVFIDKKGLRLGDKMAGTQVIKEK